MSSRYFLSTFESSSGRKRWLTKRDYVLSPCGRGISSARANNGDHVPPHRRLGVRHRTRRTIAPRGRITSAREDSPPRDARSARLELENPLYPRQVHAQLARQGQDDLEPFDGLEIVEARVSGRAGRPDQSLALVEAKGLGMDAEPLCDHADEDVAVPRGRGRVVRPGPLATRIHSLTSSGPRPRRR